MIFRKTEIKDLIIIEPKIFKDKRGYFYESYKQAELNCFIEKPINFIQENESKSSTGVLRGLHYQIGELSQSKLVRVIQGRVLDVVLDLRSGSSTFGKSLSFVLDDENKNQLLIPKGFAHGFVTLSECAIFTYKVDEQYSQESERGIKYDDPNLKIDWILPKEKIIISEKDMNNSNFDIDKRYF